MCPRPLTWTQGSSLCYRPTHVRGPVPLFWPALSPGTLTVFKLVYTLSQRQEVGVI